MERNEPLLADVRAPWDPGWRFRDVVRPKNFLRAAVYSRKYKGFWAPSSMETWRYRRLLKDLDDVCLRSLKSHGALTARELTDCLNREGLLRTRPELTGIHRISAATSHDWISLARRRGYVDAWRQGSHWELTEQGREAIHSRFGALIRRFPYSSLVVASSGLIALLNSFLSWLSVNQAVIVLMVWALILGLAIAIPHLWMSRSEKRANPGIAVVAIETLRSAGKPIPRLDGPSHRSLLSLRS